MNPDGSNLKVILEEGRKLPDGLAIDIVAGHLYWTNMGNPKVNDGSILRSDLDGLNMTTIVPAGRHLHAEAAPDREEHGQALLVRPRGDARDARQSRRLELETLVDTSRGDPRPGADPTKWCVGIAVDIERGKFYWTQKGGDNAGQGSILRASINMPPGQTAANRRDIELLYDGLPEPIDLDLDPGARMLYWTDRGDPPLGNTVNRAPLDVSTGKRGAPEIVFDHLMEGIGLALDPKGGRMFVTDLGGSIYSANLDGTNRQTLQIVLGNLSGIAYVELPPRPRRRQRPHTQR